MELETPAVYKKFLLADGGNEFGMAAISSDVWVEWTVNRPQMRVYFG